MIIVSSTAFLLKNMRENALLADGLALCGAQSAQLADTILTGEQWQEITGNGRVPTLPSGERRTLEVGIWQGKPVLLVERQAYVCEHGDAQFIRTR